MAPFGRLTMPLETSAEEGVGSACVPSSRWAPPKPSPLLLFAVEIDQIPTHFFHRCHFSLSGRATQIRGEIKHAGREARKHLGHEINPLLAAVENHAI